MGRLVLLWRRTPLLLLGGILGGILARMLLVLRLLLVILLLLLRGMTSLAPALTKRQDVVLPIEVLEFVLDLVERATERHDGGDQRDGCFDVLGSFVM